MDQIFDRLGNLLRSLFQDDDGPNAESGRRASLDPDMNEAWEELDEFLKSGKTASGTSSSFDKSGERYRRTSSGSFRGSSRTSSPIPEEIRRDYANLEVPVNSDMTTVRKSYYRLIRQYHPDRFAGNAKKLKDATEITQKINESYQRIRKYRETGKL